MKNSVFNQYHFSAFFILFVSTNAYSENALQHLAEMKKSPVPMDHLMHKPSHHAPIGIMGGEYHKKGEFMFSIRLHRMSMKETAAMENSSRTTKLFLYLIRTVWGLRPQI